MKQSSILSGCLSLGFCVFVPATFSAGLCFQLSTHSEAFAQAVFFWRSMRSCCILSGGCQLVAAIDDWGWI